MTRKLRWQKMKKGETAETEAILQFHECLCMNACSRYLKRNRIKDKVWLLRGNDNSLCAAIVHVNQNLMPVLCGQKEIPTPYFLRRIFGTVPVNSVQGIKEDALILETAMEKIGLYAEESIDYDIMCISRPPSGFSFSGPSGLVIRKPQNTDLDALAALHAAYEREEVLPAKSELNTAESRTAVSRINTERIFKNERVLVAELDGRVVGKINTNAAAFTRCQIGGVYVHPDYRNRGIARRMTGEFAASLVSDGWGISLFVKKTNPAARNIYLGIGFEIAGDYRISYY